MYKLEDIIEDLKTEKPEVSVWEVIECLEQAQDTISDLQAKVEELTNINNLLLSEHSLGGKISRDTSNNTWKNWVDACREVEAALKQEGE